MSGGVHTEDQLVERPAVDLLATLGWQTVNAYDEVLGPGGTLGRDDRREVVLQHRLRAALSSLNPDVPEHAREEAVAAITRDRSLMEPTRANREVHDLLRDGFLATWRDDGATSARGSGSTRRGRAGGSSSRRRSAAPASRRGSSISSSASSRTPSSPAGSSSRWPATTR